MEHYIREGGQKFSLGRVNQNWYKWSRPHDEDRRYANRWKKPRKKSLETVSDFKETWYVALEILDSTSISSIFPWPKVNFCFALKTVLVRINDPLLAQGIVSGKEG